MITNLEDKWQALIILYLRDRVGPTSKEEARKLRYKASHYVLIDNVLYKREHSLPLLRCLDHDETNYVSRKVPKKVCGNHSVSHSLSHKVLRQEYY